MRSLDRLVVGRIIGLMTSSSELASLVASHIPGYGIHPTSLPRVALIQSSAPTLPMPTVYEPAICLVASGRKRVELGRTLAVCATIGRPRQPHNAERRLLQSPSAHQSARSPSPPLSPRRQLRGPSLIQTTLSIATAISQDRTIARIPSCRRCTSSGGRSSVMSVARCETIVA